VAKKAASSLAAVVTLFALAQTGCFWVASQGPYLGVASIPIPVSPYFQKVEEDRHWIAERYDKVPILGPLVPGGPDIALDVPSDDEVMRALERARPVQGGMPLLWEKQRNNVRIVKEKIADYIDPPRVYPLIGPAQLHHAHRRARRPRHGRHAERVLHDHGRLHPARRRDAGQVHRRRDHGRVRHTRLARGRRGHARGVDGCPPGARPPGAAGPPC